MNETWIGTKINEQGDRVCANCGGKEIKTLCHMDGDKWYSNTFKCVNCKEIITMEAERSEESRAYWS